MTLSIIKYTWFPASKVYNFSVILYDNKNDEKYDINNFNVEDE